MMGLPPFIGDQMSEFLDNLVSVLWLLAFLICVLCAFGCVVWMIVGPPWGYYFVAGSGLLLSLTLSGMAYDRMLGYM